jgi:hypothetical protein
MTDYERAVELGKIKEPEGGTQKPIPKIFSNGMGGEGLIEIKYSLCEIEKDVLHLDIPTMRMESPYAKMFRQQIETQYGESLLSIRPTATPAKYKFEMIIDDVRYTQCYVTDFCYEDLDFVEGYFDVRIRLSL